MPLAGSGTISIGGSTSGRSVNLEFGRAAGATTSMSQLYRGGGIVPNASANNAIPTSGPISLSQFYNATNRVSIPITISANETNYVLNTAKAAGYVAGISDITLTINSGVYVSANSTGVYALDVDTSWAAGDTVTIVNNGFIVGMGGAGGAGGYYASWLAVAGSGGGPALRVQRATSINNTGTIGGGGGGGGGGSGYYLSSGKDAWSAYGGGGGGGRSGASADSAGAIGGYLRVQGVNVFPNNNGSNGTVSSAGAGGTQNTGNATYPAGNGAAGGGWGSSGGTGGTATLPIGGTSGGAGATGGSGGAAIAGNGNISWVATGTRLGAIT